MTRWQRQLYATIANSRLGYKGRQLCRCVYVMQQLKATWKRNVGGAHRTDKQILRDVMTEDVSLLEKTRP